ncbi:MAG: response regulator [Phycisphaeraceae bacterium]
MSIQSMSVSSMVPTSSQTPDASAARPVRVLVVDPSPAAGRLIKACDPGTMPMHVTRLGSLSAAQAHVAEKPVDVVVIEPNLPDGSGLTLQAMLQRRYRDIDSIIISSQPTLDDAVQAMRGGAADFLIKPLDPTLLTERLRTIIDQRQRRREQTERVRSLRRTCRRLERTRREVTQQVDMLCEDLVGAYQELADQMQHAMSRREFETVIRDELDLEPLLRKTLTFLVDKTGPTNAAVFLPAVAADEFSLGGYVNYDCAAGSADMLLEHLGDVVAPRIADRDEPVHLRDDAALAQWIGDDAAYLADCELLAFGCREEGEPLAAIVLFRDRSEPFDEPTVQTCRVIADLLGERLVKLIRIHHRATVDNPFHSDDE